MSKYKIGDKFIAEIEEIYNGDLVKHEEHMHLHRIKGFNSLVLDEYGLDKLQKYDDTCYTAGVEAGLKSIDCEVKKAYEKGLQDAWELARKIFTTECSALQKVFGHSDEGQIIMTNEPQEALAKLEAYEQEIKVGDVVEVAKGTLGIVTYANSDIDTYSFVDFTGHTRNDYKANMLTKTGRHIDIKSVLDGIGKE